MRAPFPDACAWASTMINIFADSAQRKIQYVNTQSRKIWRGQKRRNQRTFNTHIMLRAIARRIRIRSTYAFRFAIPLSEQKQHAKRIPINISTDSAQGMTIDIHVPKSTAAYSCGYTGLDWYSSSGLSAYSPRLGLRKRYPGKAA